MTFTLNKMRDQEQLKLQSLLSFGSQIDAANFKTKGQAEVTIDEENDIMHESHGESIEEAYRAIEDFERRRTQQTIMSSHGQSKIHGKQ